MKIGIIADIHGNWSALKEVTEGMKDQKIQSYIVAGDIVGYGARPNRCVQKIRELEEDNSLIAVKGNHDHAVATNEDLNWFNNHAKEAIKYTQNKIEKDNIKYLKKLKKKEKPRLNSLKTLVVHGSVQNPLFEYVRSKREEYFKKTLNNNSIDLLTQAHTHIPYVKKINGSIALNPGSVGQPRDHDPRASYCILNTDHLEAEIKRVEYSIKEAFERIKEAKLPDYLGERLKKGI